MCLCMHVSMCVYVPSGACEYVCVRGAYTCVCVRVLCHKTKRPGNTMLTQTRTHMMCAHT